MTDLQTPALLFLFIGGCLGLLVGSFLNVVIHRLPKMMEREWQNQCMDFQGQPVPESPAYNLATPRSSCPNCNHKITPLENIPVLSWLFLRGKCSNCKTPISFRYPAIELLTGVLSAYTVVIFGTGIEAGLVLICVWSLIALTFIDFDTQLLPDSITLPLMWVGIIANTFATFTSLTASVWGAIIGYMSLWSVYWAFKLTTGKEGMGYGDFKLLAAIGAWVGWQVLPLTVLVSSVLAACVGIVLIIANKNQRNVPIPFGPYLSAAGFIALFWGKDITSTYLNLV